jgi:serine/threonine protein kinase
LEGQRISHYKVLEKIGEGGMGEVYLAEDTSLERKLALKFLPWSLQRDEIVPQPFLTEAKAAAALDHPFICHIHEIGEAEAGPFIAMEYVEGETLTVLREKRFRIERSYVSEAKSLKPQRKPMSRALFTGI